LVPDDEVVERAKRSEAVKQRKLIPWKQERIDAAPGKSKKLFDARNRQARPASGTTFVAFRFPLSSSLLHKALI
jgi:hypothetical protein